MNNVRRTVPTSLQNTCSIIRWLPYGQASSGFFFFGGGGGWDKVNLIRCLFICTWAQLTRQSSLQIFEAYVGVIVCCAYSEIIINYEDDSGEVPKFERRGWRFYFPLWNVLLLEGKNQEPTHRKVGTKARLAPRGSLSKVEPMSPFSRMLLVRIQLFFFINFLMCREHDFIVTHACH